MRLLFIALFLFAFAYVSFAPSGNSCPSSAPNCLTSSNAADQHCTGGSPQCAYSPQGYPQFCYSCPTSSLNVNGKTECPNVWVIKVTDSNGAPVSGASVTATGPGPTLFGTTNSDGEVRFTSAIPGSYSVSVSRSNPSAYKTTTLTYSECSKDISINTELQCNDTVKVTILSNADNKPIKNVTINLYDNKNALINKSVTDEYGIAYVGPAKDRYSGGPDFYYIEAIPSSFYNSKKEQKYLSYPAECVIDISTSISCDHSFWITVKDDRTNKQLSGASVDILKTGTYSGRSGSTNELGVITFNNTDAGEYKITVYHPYAGSKTIIKTISFDECKQGEITGSYCNGLNIKFTDKDGKPISGSITVYPISDTSFSKPVASATTDNSGHAKMNIPKGNYFATGYAFPGTFAKATIDASKEQCDILIDTSLTCPDKFEVIVTDSIGNPVPGASITMTGATPTVSATTDEQGVASFNVAPGSYSVSVTSSNAYKTKDVVVDKAQCGGCANSSACANDEYCDIGNQTCEKIEGGTCGYVSDHQWFNYECCSDASCNASYRCDSNKCVPKKYELTVPNQTNVSNDVPVKAFEDGKPCASCDISIEDPKGNKKTVTTDNNGEASFLADLKGDYKISLVQNQTILTSKFSTASLSQSEPEDLIKRLIALLADEKVRNWLIVIVVVVIAVTLYLLSRRRGEKLKPES